MRRAAVNGGRHVLEPGAAEAAVFTHAGCREPRRNHPPQSSFNKDVVEVLGSRGRRPWQSVYGQEGLHGVERSAMGGHSSSYRRSLPERVQKLNQRGAVKRITSFGAGVVE